MNNPIRYLPIKQKIIAISMITSLVVVSLAAFSFFISQYNMNQTILVNSISSLARITGLNSQAAIMFGDTGAGNENLAALAEKTQIISSDIVLSNGNIFASYNSKQASHLSLLNKIKQNKALNWISPEASHKEERYHFYPDYFVLEQKIKERGKTVGTIRIYSDLSQISNALKWQALVILLTLMVVSFLGFLLISWLQNYILEPISRLNATIKAVSDKQDYTLKAAKYNDDELGELTDGFNLMLEQIFQRDEALAQTLEKLQKANKIAEQASRAKSNFLASMSHEIRTPMNGVLGMVNLLMQTQLDKKQLHYTQTIHNSGKTLLTIINDILDFSKIEADELHLELEPFNPGNLIVDIGHLFAERIQQSGIHFTTSISSDLPEVVVGDSNRLNQILYNLLGNAIKFTANGKISVNCRLKQIKKEKVQLYFEVEDNGTGISQEKQAHLFDAFFQAHHDQNWMHSGTGLGLAIAKKLCEMMGGSIGVESTPGTGSIFWFSVWLDQANKSDLQKFETSQATVQPENTHFSASILLAEDNLVNQEVAIGSLNYFGCQVILANNGLEALNLFKEQTFDLVFMDISMPVMDGITATREIRLFEHQRNLSETPVIAITANVFDDVEKNYLDAGINDCLSKPISLVQLLEILNKWLPHISSAVMLPETSDLLSKQQNDKEIVDRQVIEELRTIQQPGMPDIINTMVSYYLQQMPLKLQELQDLHASGDTEKLWKTAHSMKSSSAALGANEIAKTFKEIEVLGRSEQLEALPVDKLNKQFQELSVVLESLISKHTE